MDKLRKQWMDELVDTAEKMNSLMREHGACEFGKSILIYNVHEKKNGSKYGIYELAEEIGETIKREEIYDYKIPSIDSRVSFYYRGYEFVSYTHNRKGV